MMLKDLTVNNVRVTEQSDFRDIYCLYYDEQDGTKMLQEYDLSNVNEILSGMLEYEIPIKICTRIDGKTIEIWECENEENKI